jgi:hypothetical protein
MGGGVRKGTRRYDIKRLVEVVGASTYKSIVGTIFRN